MKSLIMFLIKTNTFIPLLLAGFIALLTILTIRIRSSNIKVILTSIAAIFIALFLYEGYFSINSICRNTEKKMISTFSHVKNVNHVKLGYSLPFEGSFPQQYQDWVGNIHQNFCTVKDNIRFTPNTNQTSPDFLFCFGCSFVFGFGINDQSTLPYFINDLSKTSHKVFNYGMIGYGPHQMLAQIEALLSTNYSQTSKDNFALYWFLPDHIRRSAGLTNWDRYGPLYEINNEQLLYKGPFTKKNNSDLIKKFSFVLSRSFIYRNIYIKNKFNRKATTYDVQRASAIIAKSKQLLNDLNTQFYVLVWDYPFEVNLALEKPDDFNLFLQELKDAQVNIILFSDILPFEEYEKNKHLYTLNEQDSHPSPHLNELVAKYLAKIINPQEE